MPHATANLRAVDVMLRVRGTVQGVGFRPFVHTTAEQLGLRGWVRNDTQGVLIRAAGPAGAVDELVRTLEQGPPAAARVREIVKYLPGSDDAAVDGAFVISASTESGPAFDAGVPILAGTDTPNAGLAYGSSLHDELGLLVQAGLTPIQALRSATSIPATIFGLKDRGESPPECGPI